MTAVDRATDPQPAVRPVPRSERAVATYVFEMKDRVSIRNATSLYIAVTERPHTLGIKILYTLEETCCDFAREIKTDRGRTEGGGTRRSASVVCTKVCY